MGLQMARGTDTGQASAHDQDVKVFSHVGSLRGRRALACDNVITDVCTLHLAMGIVK
jgi:hypothetical protein